MATYTKAILSGSTSGKPIKITTVATAGDLIHTAVAGAVAMDEIWIWLTNTHTAAVAATIEYGGATDPDCLVAKTLSIPPNSPPILVIAGLLLNGGLTVKIFADTANKLLASGYVNKIA